MKIDKDNLVSVFISLLMAALSIYFSMASITASPSHVINVIDQFLIALISIILIVLFVFVIICWKSFIPAFFLLILGGYIGHFVDVYGVENLIKFSETILVVIYISLFSKEIIMFIKFLLSSAYDALPLIVLAYIASVIPNPFWLVIAVFLFLLCITHFLMRKFITKNIPASLRLIQSLLNLSKISLVKLQIL